MGYYWDVWNAFPFSRLPFIPDTISDGRVCGPVEGGWPRHPRLFQSWSVARIHGVGALHVPVVMPVGVGVAPVFDFDRGPGLPPKMLRCFRVACPSRGTGSDRDRLFFEHGGGSIIVQKKIK